MAVFFGKNLTMTALHRAVRIMIQSQIPCKTVVLGLGGVTIAGIVYAENPTSPQQTPFAADAVYQLAETDKPQADSAMVVQILQQAENAKQQAQQQVIPPVQQLIQQQQQTAQQSQQRIDTALQQEKQEIQQLRQDIQQQQRQLNLDAELADNQPNIRTPEIAEKTTKTEQRSWWDRLLHRHHDEEEPLSDLPKIKVDVKVQPEIPELKNNITAKLANFTQDSFAEYDIALVQIKEMATQAAQAVGYYEAAFKFNKQDDDELQIQVKANDPVKVNSQNIEFSGAGAKTPVFQVISLVPDLNVGDILNDGLYETTKKRITAAASEQGYFDAHWLMHDVKVTLPERTADIQLKYETGDRYKLKAVEFRMSDPNKPFPLRQSVLQQLVPFKAGDNYTSWRINQLSNNLVNSRYFNNVNIEVVKPTPIEKPLELPDDVKAALAQQQTAAPAPGTPPMTTEQPTATVRQKVADESLFAGVDEQSIEQSSPQNEDENSRLQAQARQDKEIPVIVYLNADDLNSLETGLGYGTDTGPRMRLQYRRAIINDRGHNFDANLQVSKVRQSFDANYSIPYRNPLNDYFNLLGGYEREVRDRVGNDIELDIESAVAGVERVIKKPLGEWQQNYSLRYRLDRITSKGNVDYDDIPDAFKVISTDPQQQSLLLGYEISRTDQDNQVNPTRGFKQFYRAEIGSKHALSETDMAILTAGWRFIYSFGENANHQFIGRGDVGYIFTDDFDHVPYNLRYFAGGDQSIRGYDYKSLSPVQNHLLIGGQALGVGSLEYNYQFIPNWRAAIFTDVGNAYNKDFNNATKYGVGLGLRWASPIGPVSIDVAAGISEEHIPIRLHFFIGPPL